MVGCISASGPLGSPESAMGEFHEADARWTCTL